MSERHTVELSERELRAILHAFDLARDQTMSNSWRWWNGTQYVARLYDRLLHLPPLRRAS